MSKKKKQTFGALFAANSSKKFSAQKLFTSK